MIKAKHVHRLAIFGEVLFDHFPDGSAVLGGAPFNVAWHLHGLGAVPLLVSRVGADAEGRAVDAAMDSWGMDRRGVQVDPSHPTGAVRVTLKDGEPSFAIEFGQAYDFVSAAEALALEPDRPLLYHGTLALRHPVSQGALDALLRRHDPPVFVDVNLRSPWWRAEELPKLLQRAAWIKLNEGELDVLAGVLNLRGTRHEDQAERLRTRCGTSLVVVTCGERGAYAADAAEGLVRIGPAAPVAVVDTVGAGDAFSAVVMLGLWRGWPLAQILERAQDLAGAVCGLRGAVSHDPPFYQEFKTKWGL